MSLTMVLYPFVASLTLDASSGNVVGGATGSVFAKADTTFTTPLAAVDASGNPVTLTSNANGVLPSFFVDGHTAVNWVSGSWVFPLVTSEPVEGPEGPAGVSVNGATATGDDLVFSLSNGDTTPPVKLPTAPGGSDAGVASYITTPGTETFSALKATIASETERKLEGPEAVKVAIDYGHAEAVRNGVPLAVGLPSEWTLDPNAGSGTVTSGLSPEVGEYVTIAASAASGIYRIGRALNHKLGAGKFISFLVRRDNANATVFDLWGSLGASGVGTATRWNKSLSTLEVGQWYRVVLSTIEQGYSGTPTNTAKLDLRQLTIMVTSNASGPGSVSIADLRLHQGKARGKIALISDDGTDDTYTTMFPKLAAHGFPAGIAVEHINIGNPGYCTVEQLKEMHAAGWDMYGHHRTDMTTLTAAQQRAVYEDAKAFQAANEFTNGNRIWVWPGGLRNAATEAVASEYWATMRRVQSFTESGAPHVYAPTDPPMYYLTKNKTAATIKAKIDDVAATGYSMVLTLHKILPTAVATEDISIATFDEVVAHLAASNVDVVPASQLWTR